MSTFHSRPFVRMSLTLWFALALALASLASLAFTQSVSAATSVFINEFHYDNAGSDTGEAIEIRAEAGADLTGWSIVLYNGNGGARYNTKNLAGVVDDSGDGFGYVVVNISGIQNGSPDSIALVDNNGNVVEFLSYEGSFTAVGGPADGLTSTDIGVAEGSSTDVGESLQLINDVWTGPIFSTFGAANVASVPGQPLPLVEDFDSCALTGWEIISVDSDTANTWSCSTQYSNADVNGYGDSAPSDEWLITPALDMDAQADEMLNFRSYTNYTDSGVAYPQLEVVYSTDYAGDPTSATWIPLSDITFSPEDSGDWTDSGSIDLSGINGSKVYFAFHYTSSGTTGGSAANWRIDGISFEVNDGPGEPDIVKIHEIQGSGAASPLDGQTVIIEGVVVGDFQNDADADSGDLNGFFVQEEDADADADDLTSEGIFVYYNNVAVNPGDVVRVTGVVDEYYNLTELTDVSTVEIVGAADLPTPATVNLPVSDISDFEAFEGMAVIFPQELVISEYYNYDRYGEMVLAQPLNNEDRPYNPTAVELPANAQARKDANALSRITLDDGLTAQNPDVLRHPNGGDFAQNNYFRGGDKVKNTVGVLNYAYDLYRIQPTSPAEYIEVNTRADEPADVGGRLKVASFNVLNYFLTLDDGQNDICGANQNLECRGADNQEEFERQEIKIVKALLAIDADVVGLIEMENTPGVDPLARLVGQLNAQAGEGAYDYINTDLIGTDAIRVGFIYKPGSVTPTGLFKILDSSVDPRFIDAKNRPALAQTFTENATGARFTAVVNHFKSKGSGCGAGDDDPLQGNCNGTRTLAAQALADWLAGDPTGSNDPDFLIIGDLNAYAKEDPIAALEGANYINLIAQFFQGSTSFPYSYVFSGEFGYLDYALANGLLVSQVTGVSEWHINADEADAFDYDTSYKPDPIDALYQDNAFRASDHDPVIVGLDLTGEAATITVDKTLDTNRIVQGGTMTATITYSVDRDAVVTVVDQLPDAMQLLSADPMPTSVEADGKLTWELGQVAAGEYTISLQVKTFNIGRYTNEVTVSEYFGGSASDSATVRVLRDGKRKDYVTLAAVANEPNDDNEGGRGSRGTVAIIGVRADGTTALLSSFDTGAPAAEILAFTPNGKQLLVTDSENKALLVINVRNPWNPRLLTSVAIPNGGEPSSVVVRSKGDYALVTVIDPNDNLNNGKVFKFNLRNRTFDAGTEIGPHPDSIAIALNGAYALVTNEADDDGDAGGPEGSLSILQLGRSGVENVTIVPVSSLAGAGYGDFTQVEPEYAGITPDGRFGVFTIQDPEDDTALAVIDLATGEITDLQRFSLLGNGGKNPNAEPDGVTVYAFNGQNYAATANEEDQSVSIWEIGADGTLTLLNTVRVEEYLPVPVDTDPSSSGQPDGLGNTTGLPADDPNFPFDDGEPDPEGIASAVIDGKAMVIVGLEESGAALVLDVSNPNAIVSLDLERNLSADVLEADASDDDRPSFTGRPEGIAIYSKPDRVGALQITKIVQLVDADISIDETFEICISGPSFYQGDCKQVAPEDLAPNEATTEIDDDFIATITWTNLEAGRYNISEVDTSGIWKQTYTPRNQRVSVSNRNLTTAQITNTYCCSYIKSINLKERKGKGVEAKVIAVYSNGEKVDWSYVHAEWTLPDGSTFEQTMPTNGQGRATFLAWPANGAAGDYTFRIVGITDPLNEDADFCPERGVTEASISLE